jgi:hypothetical protein
MRRAPACSNPPKTEGAEPDDGGVQFSNNICSELSVRNGPTKPFFSAKKPSFAANDANRKQSQITLRSIDQQWSSIMWAIISSVYRSYCLARLLEMRRYHRVHA